MSTKRMVSLGMVALLHVFLGYAFISGLALRAVKVVTGPLETVNIEEPTVPEEPPPPPPPELEEIPPYVPPPDVVVETRRPPPPIRVQTQAPPPPAPRVVISPPAPAPAPPAPVATGPTRGPVPRGTRSAISQDDYPAASRRAEEEGTVRVSYEVSAEGRVTPGSCQVVQSSGHNRLDERTCEVIERRFRFDPALKNGEEVTARRTDAVRWQLTD